MAQSPKSCVRRRESNLQIRSDSPKAPSKDFSSRIHCLAATFSRPDTHSDPDATLCQTSGRDDVDGQIFNFLWRSCGQEYRTRLSFVFLAPAGNQSERCNLRPRNCPARLCTVVLQYLFLSTMFQLCCPSLFVFATEQFSQLLTTKFFVKLIDKRGHEQSS